MKEDTMKNSEFDEEQETDVFALLHQSWKETVPSIKS